MASLLDFGIDGNRIRNGTLAGLAGGLVFGTMMSMMGMMPMVAMLVGSTSVLVGWTLHLIISVAFGVGLAVLTRPVTTGAGILLGAAWGLLLWMGAAMLVMRLVLGMPIAFDTPAMMSMMGHLLFGAIAGLVLAWRNRATHAAGTKAHSHA